MNVSDRTLTNNIRGTFTALGVKAPTAVARAFAQVDLLADGAAQLSAEPGGVELAVTAAIIGKRDLATDADVLRALTHQALAGSPMLADNITAAAVDRLRDTCTDHRDTIVTAWAEVFDKAATALVGAHQRIGDLDLIDTTPILAKGGDVADVWAEAQNAARVLDTVVTGWTNLMMFLRVSLDPAHRPLKLADMTLEQWLNLPAKLEPWGAVRAGIPLDLPTLDAYRQRVATIQHAQSVRAAQSQAQADPEREANKKWAARMVTVR